MVAIAAGLATLGPEDPVGETCSAGLGLGGTFSACRNAAGFWDSAASRCLNSPGWMALFGIGTFPMRNVNATCVAMARLWRRTNWLVGEMRPHQPVVYGVTKQNMAGGFHTKLIIFSSMIVNSAHFSVKSPDL